MISASARLLRGFAVDFLTCHNRDAAAQIMDSAYRLSIGGHVLDGRDASYLPATVAQLDQFPGLCVTVHDTIIGEDWAAMRFTEHGASVKHGGRVSTWGGVTLFRIESGRLREGWAEEDYLARKRQLATGLPDPVPAPHPAPWDGVPVAANPAAEAAARAWLERLSERPAIEEISAEGPRFAELVRIGSVTVSTLFTAGPRAAFHAVCRGTYAGGFEDIVATGQTAVLRLAGMLTIDGGDIVKAQVAADRLGLYRALLGAR